SDDQKGEKAGGGAGGGGGGPAGPTAGSGGGEGTWKTTVVGEVTEKIGGLAAINSLGGVTFGVNGATKEMVGAGRLELIKNGKATSIEGASKAIIDASNIELNESPLG